MSYWTGQQDYGTQQVKSTPVTTGFGGEKKVWHKSQSGKLGKAIAASKKQNPQAWKKATGPKPGSMDAYWNLHTDRPGTTYESRVGEMLDKNPQAKNWLQSFGQESKATQVVQKTAMTGVRKAKTGATTWYATNAQGQTVKGEGKLSLQARQFYGDRGYNLITSKPPKAPLHQQRLSDETGITTYTQYGDISTTPRDLSAQTMTKTRKEQQKLSDKYGITTYNKDGSVSTIPTMQQQQEQQQQAKGSWWWDSPFTVSAEKDKKEKPWGWW